MADVLVSETRSSSTFHEWDAPLCAPMKFYAYTIWLIVLSAIAPLNKSLAVDVSPQPEPPFNGKIGISAQKSIPDWPKPVTAPKNAPNIVIILLDDIGFAETSTFGGVAQTPELSKLAQQGLRYNNFNATAKCSPTRAALLTGRNHHRVGFGQLAGLAEGYPGYDTVWKKSTASIAAVLRSSGYSTAAFGKWHNTPAWEITLTGPFDRWPTGLGFEYFYGFIGLGADNQWEPRNLYRNTTPVDPPAQPGQRYHLTTDLTDEAIRWVRTHESLAPERPYFLYFATGAVHNPHHAPSDWIERYRSRFDKGWDQLRKETFARQKGLGVIPSDARLTPRPKEVPAWSSLSTDQRKLYARQMEVYAGFIAHTDAQIGRLLQTVRSGPNADNTLILYIVGDNGASGEGGLDGFVLGAATFQEQLRQIDVLGSGNVTDNLYSMGWAWVGNTPFQWWKNVASHFGGTRAPLIVSWPARIKDRGGLRTQFTHVTDVAATLYDAIGLKFPSVMDGTVQKPLDGLSFAQTFSDSRAPSLHRTQYFEYSGNRALYHDGWVAAARHTSADQDFAKDRWELYHVTQDFSEALDLAQQNPDKLRELQALFDVEARKNDVYPLGAVGGHEGPSLTAGKRKFIYYPETQRIPAASLPVLGKYSYLMTADIMIPESGAEGVIASCGDRSAGFVWYVKGGYSVYENRVGMQHQVLTSQVPLPRGRVALTFAFERDVADKDKKWWEVRSGTGRLYINGQLSAQANLPLVFHAWAPPMFVGRGAESPVSTAFSQPFAFTGTLEKLTVELQ